MLYGGSASALQIDSRCLLAIILTIISFRFLDGTTKIINIDETKCVSCDRYQRFSNMCKHICIYIIQVKLLIRDICEQLNIENPVCAHYEGSVTH